MLKALLLVCVLALGVLMAGCSDPEDEGDTSNVPKVTDRPVEGASGGTQPSNVADAVLPAIDEASIRADLAHLSGASPAPLAGGPTAISERRREDGRRAAAQYLKESFDAVGIPARILEFTFGDWRGFNVEATLEGTEGRNHLWPGLLLQRRGGR